MGRAGRLLRAPGGSGFGACPVCGRNLPLARLPAHVERCLLEGSRDGDGDGGGVKRRLHEEECRQGYFGRRTAARLAGPDGAGPRRGAGGGGTRGFGRPTIVMGRRTGVWRGWILVMSGVLPARCEWRSGMRH